MQFQGSYVLIHLCTGSSAPEILLAVIGIIGNNFESEKLGPSTIVGSVYMLFLLIFVVICDDDFETMFDVLPRQVCLVQPACHLGCLHRRGADQRDPEDQGLPRLHHHLLLLHLRLPLDRDRPGGQQPGRQEFYFNQILLIRRTKLISGKQL